MIHVFLIMVPALILDHILDEARIDVIHELQAVLVDLLRLVELRILEIGSVLRLLDGIFKLLLYSLV